MNNNPFTSIDDQLRKLESLTVEVLQCIAQLSAPSPEIGGIELAQQITRLSKPRIYALVSARQIPHSKRGNKLYFSRTNLLEWIDQGNRRGKAETSYEFPELRNRIPSLSKNQAKGGVVASCN
jgi:hypothetical protein